MPKRRERDRPKAAPGSLHNPHKRVLLSYDSEDEGGGEQETPTAHEHPEVAEEACPGAVNDEEEQMLEETEVVRNAHEAQEDGVPPEADPAANKVDKEQSKHNYEPRRVTRRNETTGQWTALGSLSYQWDDDYDEEEEYDSTEEDAMAYLRAVRYERQNMPYVLTAPRATSKADPYESIVEDTRGYLEDGAYVGSANVGPQLLPAVPKSVDPQESYTVALKERFLRQRERLHTSPVPGAVEALDNDHPISFPWHSNRAHASWYRVLRTIPPHPTQMQAMEQSDVLNLLRLLQKHLLVREKHLSPTTSSWIWALLTRLDDVGTMNNGQVWNLRELGKKAILVQLSFEDPGAAAELEAASADDQDERKPRHGKAVVPGEELIDDSKTDEAEAEDSSVVGKNDDDEEDDIAECQHTLATLDAILVVVGEIYGQRDLLEFRKAWERDPSTDARITAVE